MSKQQKVFDKVMSGNSDANISFEELRSLLLAFGFNEKTVSSHHRFSRAEFPESLNLQRDEADKGKAKKYQVKQVRGYFKKYRLSL